MSASRDAVAADAIIAEINARTWTQSFKAERFYVRSTDKEDIETLQVHVQPIGSLEARATRRHRKIIHEIGVVVLKSIEPENTAAIDALNALAQEIADYFAKPRGRHKITGTQLYARDVQPLPPDPDKLLERRFVGGLKIFVEQIVVDL